MTGLIVQSDIVIQPGINCSRSQSKRNGEQKQKEQGTGKGKAQQREGGEKRAQKRTIPVPKRRSRRPLFRLETIVLAETVMDRKPAAESGASNSGRITGQAEPRMESGKPRLMKAR